MTVNLALDVNEQALKTSRSQDNELPSSQERNHEYVEWKDDYVVEDDHESILSSSVGPALAGRRFFVENLPVHSEHCNEAEDEAPSLCASSVSSSSDESSDVATPRCVSFLDPLVSEVRYRPRTLPEDCEALFYTSDETRQFRRDYHIERNQEHFDAPSAEQEQQDQTPKSYDISRVVIMANNSTIQYENNPWNNTYGTKISESKNVCASSDSEEIFFDNDSFWTGSITWY
jgi:hypothetical protein